MKRMSPEAKVGLLVLSGLLILVYMALRVGKIGLGAQEGYSLYLELDNAVGLNRDGDVLVAGIPVGKISEIHLDRSKAVLRLQIHEGVKLARDSTASVKTHGVLGEKYVEILPGQSPDFLADGDWLRAGPPPGDLDRLVASLSEISADVKRVTASLANVFGTPQGEQDIRDLVVGFRDTAQGLRELVRANREALRESVANLRVVTAQMRGLLEANREALETTLANARRFSETLAESSPAIAANLETLTGELGGLVAENRENLRVTLSNLRESTAKLSATLDSAQALLAAARSPDSTVGRLLADDSLHADLRGAVGDLRAVLSKLERGEGTLGKLVSDDALYADLKGTTDNLRSISGKIDSGEGTLGKLVNEPTVHENLNQTLTGINDFVSVGNRFQFEVGYAGEFLFGPGKAKNYFNLDIRPRQDRFYRVAVVKDPRGKVDTETIEKIDDNTGETISKVEKETTEDKLKFSAQLGKRFSNLTLRGGLIESTGGVGTDLHFWDDRLKLSLEAFDFAGDQGGPHAKFGARWDFWNHVFLTGGVDALMGPDGDVNGFLGGGFFFVDEDLRYLISPAARLAQ